MLKTGNHDGREGLRRISWTGGKICNGLGNFENGRYVIQLDNMFRKEILCW